MKKKFITTTLPFPNGNAHIGFCFEACIADVITGFFRQKLGKENVFLNLGLDENSIKIYQKSIELGYSDPQDYCDDMASTWKGFCDAFQIDYDNFYRTTDVKHKEQVIRYFNEIGSVLYKKKYEGKYCVGCESFKTDKEIVNNRCSIHNTEVVDVAEENIFFPLKKYAPNIKDILVNKSLSLELSNMFKDDYDLSITRKNLVWGVKLNEEDTVYVWFDALLNYVFSIKFYEDREYFDSFWEDSLQICGKDNLKFQAYIFQAMLLANNIPQTKELLVHGTILDSIGNKMSKTTGNVIDPMDQLKKFGLSPLKYYLVFGLSTYDDSKYSVADLISIWNSDIVNGFGNVVSRTLHLIDIKEIVPSMENLTPEFEDMLEELKALIDKAFTEYRFDHIRNILNSNIAIINKRFQDEKPYGKDCVDYRRILNEIYFHIRTLSIYYTIILKEHKLSITEAFLYNKKVILFKPIILP